MDCTFSNPVDYQGNPPSTDLSSFAFKSMSCNIQNFSTFSAQTQTATTASIIDFSPDLTTGFAHVFFILFFILGLIIWAIAFWLGNWFYQARK